MWAMLSRARGYVLEERDGRAARVAWLSSFKRGALMKYTRSDSDADGETHFGSGEIDLSMTNFAVQAPLF
jgi:hypothetical protein